MEEDPSLTSVDVEEILAEKWKGMTADEKYVYYVPEEMALERDDHTSGEDDEEEEGPGLSVGNTCHAAQGEEQEQGMRVWTLFVRGADPHQQGNEALYVGEGLQIASVIFRIHPDFDPSEITVTAPPFEVTRTGWGTFEASLEITYSNGAVQALVHMLEFEEELTFDVLPVDSSHIPKAAVRNGRRRASSKVVKAAEAAIVSGPTSPTVPAVITSRSGRAIKLSQRAEQVDNRVLWKPNVAKTASRVSSRRLSGGGGDAGVT